MTQHNGGVDLTGDYIALRQEVGAVWLPRDFLRVHGPDAVSFLQGQLSQDVAALAPGSSADSFLLQPQGKVEALVRATRTGEDEMVLDVDAGFGEAVQGRLQRFKLRVKAELDPLPWKCLALRGPGAHEVEFDGGGLVLANDWPGLPGVDVVGEDLSVPDGLRICGPQAWEAVRIEAGIPAMGAELNEKTIPAEAGIVERTVSFTKGCYTGQELVARIDSRGGHVPRHLRGVLITTNVIPPVGAELAVEGRSVGSLTSVAESLARRAPVALAYVKRDVEVPAEAEVRWEGGSAPARIEALPLVR